MPLPLLSMVKIPLWLILSSQLWAVFIKRTSLDAQLPATLKFPVKTNNRCK